jgi:hypothetical protein
MKTWALLITIGLYIMTAVDFYMQGNKGMALAFVSYALANVGFIYA